MKWKKKIKKIQQLIDIIKLNLLRGAKSVLSVWIAPRKSLSIDNERR